MKIKNSMGLCIDNNYAYIYIFYNNSKAQKRAINIYSPWKHSSKYIFKRIDFLTKILIHKLML